MWQLDIHGAKLSHALLRYKTITDTLPFVVHPAPVRAHDSKKTGSKQCGGADTKKEGEDEHAVW